MLDGINGYNYNSNTSGKGSSVLGKDDFMNLFITQLKYQDPMSPLESHEFAAQLANFSSLEQLSNLNENVKMSLDANYLLAQSINNTMSATLIGKDVKLGGNAISNAGTNNVELGYKLPVDASDVTVEIYNSAGILVREIKDLEKTKGEHKLSFDFTDNKGSKLPNGDYTFKFAGKNLSDEDITIESYKFGSIESVKFGEYGTTILVNGVEYQLSDIMEILNSGVSPDSKGTKSNG